jgi:DNA-binding PadR family transcriptional regulator
LTDVPSSGITANVTSQTFQILLALADGPLHGYAIIRDIRERTNGDVRLTASTLYDALARLVDERLLEETETPHARPDHDHRRRYYQLTRLGRARAEAEAQRFARLVAAAHAKKLLKSK